MQEVFYEESSRVQNERGASIRYNIVNALSIFSYVCMIIWFILVCSFFSWEGNVLINLILVLLPFAILLVCGMLLGKYRNKLYVDYDYTFVNGSIRFSKVIKNIKRKFIAKFDCSKIEKIGKITSETFNRYKLIPNIKTVVLTSNDVASDGKSFFYIVANIEDTKTIFILECSETFMINVLKFSNKMVLEEELKK